MHRPSAALPAPRPAGPGERWLWYDRAIRFERWHPTIIVAGSYTGMADSTARTKVFESEQNVVGTITSNPNLTLLVRTYDYHAFNLWPALTQALMLSVAAGVLEWYLRKNTKKPKGLCRACGYDLRASPDRCPECGAVPVGPIV